MSLMHHLLNLLETGGNEARVCVTGVEGGMRAYFLAELARRWHGPLVVVASDPPQARSLVSDLPQFWPAGEAPPLLMSPPIDPYSTMMTGRQDALAWMAGLAGLSQGLTPRTVVLSPDALARRTLTPEHMSSMVDLLGPGEEVDREELRRRLILYGFSEVSSVEEPGAFAVRGAVVDIFSPFHGLPVRMELFGDEIERMRLFDPATQLTQRDAEYVILHPLKEVILGEEEVARMWKALPSLVADVRAPREREAQLREALKQGRSFLGQEALMPVFHPALSSLAHYMPPGALWVIDDPEAAERRLWEVWERLSRTYMRARARHELALAPEEHVLPPEEAIEEVGRPLVECRRLVLDDGSGVAHLSFPPEPSYLDLMVRMGVLGTGVERLDPLMMQVRAWKAEDLAVVMAVHSGERYRQALGVLRGRGLNVKAWDGQVDWANLDGGPGGADIHLVSGPLRQGFIFREGRLVLLTADEVFGAQARRQSQRSSKEKYGLASWRDLEVGDLVVHADHGIACFEGMRRLEVGGQENDFLVLAYQGGDRLYLPAHRLDKIQKYVGAGSDKTRLDKLGGTAWEKTKAKIKDAMLGMAAELLKLNATRQALGGLVFPPADPTFEQFEASFPYEETPDQRDSIDAVLADMERPVCMDRLVCGDVGFGKTEVALRAAFKAVLGNKQVAILVPTTVLALQHEATFKERLADFPVRIEMLSRLRSRREQNDVLQHVAEGKVDILIGTHKLFQPDIQFRDLGLLIIDEEQRFGVAQKERLKQMRKQVDVLTLTATPIPRTLHMAMAGLRDISIIATPPLDRRAVETIICPFDEGVIREGISRELARGGQVFFLHNQVRGLEGVVAMIKRLVPEARVVMAHGQMKERDLERVMMAFVGREYDVLVCTTIIESGLDIPSVNTLFVNRADRFGLAQLYQIRGRVGRSRWQAYAYLLVPSLVSLTNDARQRLAALQRFVDLGSGFQIASMDMELRGAGDLLGASQSGHIAAVGFDLYTQLLDEAVQDLSGRPKVPDIEPELNLDLPCFIPDSYIPDSNQRLRLYRQLSMARPEELEDLVREWEDRFGSLPQEVISLIEMAALRGPMRHIYARRLDLKAGTLAITLDRQTPLDPTLVAKLIRAKRFGLRLVQEWRLSARVEGEAPQKRLEGVRAVLRALEECLPGADGKERH